MERHFKGQVFSQQYKAPALAVLHYFYITVIRPISEYACTVWNPALWIIYGDQIKEMPYLNILFLANLESLKDRREKISKSFFNKNFFQ